MRNEFKIWGMSYRMIQEPSVSVIFSGGFPPAMAFTSFTTCKKTKESSESCTQHVNITGGIGMFVACHTGGSN